MYCLLKTGKRVSSSDISGSPLMYRLKSQFDPHRLDLIKLIQKGKNLMLYFLKTDMKKIADVCSSPDFRGRILFSAGEKPYLTLKLQPGESPLDAAVILVDLYAGQ